MKTTEFAGRLYDIMNYARYGKVEILTLMIDLDTLDNISVHFSDGSKFHIKIEATDDVI